MHLSVSLTELLSLFAGGFARPESFAVFQPVVAAWILCLRWYKKTVGDTFAEMLGAMRLWLWHQRLVGEAGDRPVSMEMVENLLNEMAAVG